MPEGNNAPTTLADFLGVRDPRQTWERIMGHLAEAYETQCTALEADLSILGLGTELDLVHRRLNARTIEENLAQFEEANPEIDLDKLDEAHSLTVAVGVLLTVAAE